MNLSIDKSRCIGCGMCAATVPEVFRVLDAANGCPVNAIRAKRD